MNEHLDEGSGPVCALVTGGLGFLGSFVVRRLLESKRCDRVVCLDNFGRYVDSVAEEFVDYRRKRVDGISESIVIERGDARHHGTVQRIVDRYRPRYIFHLAALPLATISNSSIDEAMEGAVASTANILDIVGRCPSYRPDRFVYVSSSMVYGDFLTEPACEDHPTNPRNVYGTAKLMGEVLTRGLGDVYGIPYAIVRPSAIYGPTDMNRRVVHVFLERARLGRRITIQGADQRLDFTYVKDAANGVVLAATSDLAIGQTFNITCGEAYTLLELADAIKVHFPNLAYEVVERDGSLPQRGALSIVKAMELLKYSPRYSLQAGLREYVAFLQESLPCESR